MLPTAIVQSLWDAVQDFPAAPMTAACLALLAGTPACDVKLSGADTTVPNLNGGPGRRLHGHSLRERAPAVHAAKEPQEWCAAAATLLLGGWGGPGLRAPACRSTLSSWPAGRLPLPVPVPMQCLPHLSPESCIGSSRLRRWLHMLEPHGSSEHATRGLWHTTSAVLH